MALNKKRFSLSFTTLLLSCSVLVPHVSVLVPHVQAQSSAPSNSAIALEEIVVTTRKREENLRDVPISIVAVSSQQLDNLGISDLSEIAKIVPGLTFDRGITATDFRPAIRGLQAERGRNSVGVLIDDIDITTSNLQGPGGGGLARSRLMDIERVEVVKGPQAALYGRAAFGGAINYVTKRPSLSETDFSGTVEADSESTYQFKASAGAPVIEEKLGVRANAYYWDARGSFRNAKSGDYVGGGDGVGVAGAFLAQATENLSFYGRLEYSDEHYDPPAAFVANGNTVVNFDADQQAGVPGPATSGTIFTGPVEDGQVLFDIDPRTGEDYPGSDQKTLRATLITEWELGPVELKSLTSWVDNDFGTLQDNDFVSGSENGVIARGAFQEADRLVNTRQFSQEIRLSSIDEGPLQWMAGGLYWEEELDQFWSSDAGFALAPITDADAAALFSQTEGLNGDGVGGRLGRDTYHWSAFAWAEYAITDNVFAAVEGRYTDEKADYVFDTVPPYTFFYGVLPGATPGDPILIPLGTATGIARESVSEGYFAPKASVSYRPSDELNLYASIAKGVKPSGHDTGDVTISDNTFYLRETLWAYEVGVKSLLADRSLALNVAGFYQDYKDQQVASQIFSQETQLLTPVTENAGQSTILGFELETNWRATEHLSLGGSYVFVDAEFDSFRVLSTSGSRIAESGCGTLVTFGPGVPPACELNKDGNRPPDSPKHQIKLNVAYVAPFTDAWDWFAEADFSYTSRRELETANVAWQEAYSITDIRLGLSSDTIRATAFVDNLFDDRTVTDANQYVDFFNGFAPSAFGFKAQPLTVGLRLSVAM